ncbi:MAG: alpha/beta hydrolase [bacterium]|nr:alpha/beta hydrolase [bacterium]
METYEIKGLFSDIVKIYHYPSIRSSNNIILVLKGIYSEHVPREEVLNFSWDHELVKLMRDNYHLIFVRTSRLKDRNERDAFVGKTFKQECVEIENAFEYCNKNIFSQDYRWGCVSMSFGGTTLLGIPEVLSEMQVVIMAGSGCGKSPTTIKPLLSSLPHTEQLLHSLDNYRGVFIFLHGVNDTVVPKKSQQLIYERAVSAAKRKWVELQNLDHTLRDMYTGKSSAANIMSQYIRKIF